MKDYSVDLPLRRLLKMHRTKATTFGDFINGALAMLTYVTVARLIMP